ncbi:unnamed protein product [Dicrocoelium dendriticum]|nr:unnamed protein product [Dicrocoelium dendriticum]
MATVALRTKVMKEAITVVCRIRPLNQAERTKSSAACLTFPSSTSVCIGGKTYTFDMVFTPTATQTEVYEKSAKSIVASVLNGYNGTLFAYGQTASGKTYTMEGVTERFVSCADDILDILDEGKMNRHVSTHVPYRDSKLTRILQQSLGGNSKTTIIIAASPAASNEAETRSTLIFGVRAKNIKNQVVPNTQLTSEEWRRLYERELDRSRQLYSALTNLDAEVRRWRNGETIPREKWFTEDQYGKSFYELANELSEICTAASASETLFAGGATDPCFSSAGVIPLSDSARLKIRRPTSSDDTQLAELFRLLDEKDDEINQQCQLVARLEVQLTRTRDDYARASRENDKLQTLLQKAQRDADVRRNEVKDVLQALEELAITYDEKNTECKKVAKELEDVTTEMSRIKEQLDKHEADAEELRTNSATLREKLRELIYSLNVELHELGCQLNEVITHTTPERSSTVEEQAAVLKLYVLQIKSELNTLLKGTRVVAPDIRIIQSSPTETLYSTHTPLPMTEYSEEVQREYERKMKEASTKEVTIMDEESVDTQSVGTAVQRERIQFMKSSLDNLTRAHKQLVRDNADLRCEIPKLEKRVKASLERIKDLEVALRESKEAMIRDKRRYNQEIDRIKETGWARANTRLRTNIGKPIRAGQTKDVI